MANDKAAKRRGGASEGSHGDGQAGAGPSGERVTDTAPQAGLVAKPVPAWEAVMLMLDKAEQANPRLRIVRVWHPKAPDIWQGVYGNAIVVEGDPAYQLSSGEIIAI